MKRGIWPVAGCDEAGRGPLAGPVVAAAVILDPTRVPRGLDDSKKLDAETREKLYARICASAEVAVAVAPPARIDRDNILRASLWALARAVAALPVRPRLVFVDGRDRIEACCECQAVISGDAIIASIAAASIVAKVTRDRLMIRLGALYPGYGFERHKGYSVPEHFDALNRLGPTVHHRRSFAPVAAAYGDPAAEAKHGRLTCCLSSAGALSLPVCPAPGSTGPMLYVSIFVELIRSRPALAVWIAVILQAALWFLLPAIFYTAPPGDLPAVLAVGHEFQLGTYLGPPLAFWLAEVAYDIAGGRMIGVYLLSQICVVVTYWAVFTLGRAVVGPTHAALAVLLMAGVAAFTIPTPDFGPVILTMPLWSIILLHYWRAVGENRRGYWLVLAIEIGLLLLTTYVGLILIGLLVLFTVGHPRARRALRTSDPWIAAVVAVIVTLPHLVWLADSASGIMPVLARLRSPEAVTENFVGWLRQIGIILTVACRLC